MRGSLLIEKHPARLSRLLGGEQARTLLLPIAVGVVAGLLMAHVRLHLGLPGSKAVLWMSLLVWVRLIGRCPMGATVAGLVAAVTKATSGHYAGVFAHVPLVTLAGGTLDAAIGFACKHRLSARWTVLLVSVAALGANMLFVVKRLFVGSGFKGAALWGLSGPGGDLLSRAFFGLLAGLIGVALAYGTRRRRQPPRSDQAPTPPV